METFYFGGGNINLYLLSVFFILIPFPADHPALCQSCLRDFLFFQAESQSGLKPNALSVFCKKLSLFHKTLIPKGEWEGESDSLRFGREQSRGPGV